MAWGDEFKKFLFRGNVVDLAVGVVIGGAFGKIVSAFVDDLVMPLVAPLLPGGDWREATVTSLNIKVGHLLGTLLDFLIVAGVIFVVLVKLVGALSRQKAEPPPPGPATKTCQECLETVPAAARRCKFCTSVLAALALLLMGAPAFAQVTPKFEYGAPPADAKPEVVEWAALVKGGLLLTSGNAQSVAGNLSLNVSRKAGDNRFALDANAAYGESNNRVFRPANAGAADVIDNAADIEREEVPVTNLWAARARYDRFLTEKNTAYLLGSILRDKIAGKDIFGGGQVGYSRLLVANEAHEVVGEFGYDLTFESYFAEGADNVIVHSARLFVGEIWKASADTAVYGNVEALFNLNRENDAFNADVTNPTGPADQPQAKGVGAFKDTRVNAKAGLNTKLWKNLSFGFGVTLRYDQNPASLDATFGPNFRAFANEVDVITDASLIVTLL